MPSEHADPERPPSWWARVRNAIAPRRRAELARGEAAAQADPRRNAASRARLRNVAAFERLRVDDVMVPRADIVALDVSSSLAEAAEIFSEAAHSRLPVYRETLDDPVGMVHIKDVVRHLASGGNGAPLEEKRILDMIKRPVLYAPPSMPAADLLLRMQSRRVHMALVVDEYGGTDGLVTLEDLVEEIIGDIEDEHSQRGAPGVRQRGAQIWDADARAPIEDLERFTGRALELADMTEEVDTLGGLLFTLAGRVPERGEVIRHPAGLDFEVVDADPRRIRRLVVRVADTLEPGVGAGAGDVAQLVAAPGAPQADPARPAAPEPPDQAQTTDQGAPPRRKAAS